MESLGQYILDKSKFTKVIKTQAIKFPASQSSRYLKDYKEYLMNLEKTPNIPKDFKEGDRKLLLLNPRYTKDDYANWPAALKSLVDDNGYELVEYEVKLNYDDLTMQDILAEILPKDVTVPAGFETVGNIAHLNLRASQLPYKNVIGQVLLDKNSKIRTVVNKTEKLSNVFRTPELEVIAGENQLDTELKEGGCTFKLNFEKVYWNSRLQTERDRILIKLNAGEVLCDMFCGIGPLSIRAAKKDVYVLANDLNPDCYDFLKVNAKVNKVEKMIECYNMDAREFVKHIVLKKEPKVHFGHVYMNLPMDAVEFLDVFTGLFKEASREVWNEENLPVIYVNGFDTGKTPEEVNNNFLDRISKAFGETIDPNTKLDIHAIKDISSEKKMYCVIFKLPKEIAFGGTHNGVAEDYEKVEKKLKVD